MTGDKGDSRREFFDIPRMAYTYDEASRALGISIWALRRLVERGKIPVVKIDGRGGRAMVRFRPEAIAAWLQEKEQRYV